MGHILSFWHILTHDHTCLHVYSYNFVYTHVYSLHTWFQTWLDTFFYQFYLASLGPPLTLCFIACSEYSEYILNIWDTTFNGFLYLLIMANGPLPLNFPFAELPSKIFGEFKEAGGDWKIAFQDLRMYLMEWVLQGEKKGYLLYKPWPFRWVNTHSCIILFYLKIFCKKMEATW